MALLWAFTICAGLDLYTGFALSTAIGIHPPHHERHSIAPTRAGFDI